MTSTCHHCGEPLEGSALRCPACGDPTPRANRRVVVVLVAIALLGLVTGLVAALLVL